MKRSWGQVVQMESGMHKGQWQNWLVQNETPLSAPWIYPMCKARKGTGNKEDSEQIHSVSSTNASPNGLETKHSPRDFIFTQFLSFWPYRAIPFCIFAKHLSSTQLLFIAHFYMQALYKSCRNNTTQILKQLHKNCHLLAKSQDGTIQVDTTPATAQQSIVEHVQAAQH